MAQCLEFDQIITKVGRFAESVPSGTYPYRAKFLLYTVPANHVAKINKADNLGSGLMYGVTSASGNISGTDSNGSSAINVQGGAAGESLPSRHRSLNGTWMSAGDKLYAYDLYDMQNTSVTSHPDGFYAVIVEYLVTTC